MKSSLSKNIELEYIGTVKLTKRRGRSIRISLDREGSVICSMPTYISQKEALSFIESKKDWIIKNQLIIKSRKRPPIDLTNGFKTRFHTLVLSPEISNTIKTTISKDIIRIQYPGQLDIKSNEMQQLICSAIEETWRKEAKQVLINRTIELANQFNFTINDVKIRKTISRWGSCSYINNISLSLYLMQLTDELVDMVILHELCHTIEKNHGPKYKALLLKVCANVKQLEKDIKRYSVYPF